MNDRASVLVASGGMAGALRALAATLGEALRIRGSLLGVELREELERRRQLLVMAVVAAAFLHMALLVLTAVVAVAFWDTHRMAALSVIGAFYLACGAAALIRLRLTAAASPPAFAASLGELQRDLAQLNPPQ
jgi:uncharacterized membrane protein YqjE